MTKINRPYPRFSQDFSGESQTQQHFTEQCDITNIVEQYARTGHDPYADRLANQRFGNATSKTYDEAMREVAQVQSDFNELPQPLREQYDNDPANYLSAIEALQLPEPEPTPDPVPEPAPEPSQEPPADPPQG